MSNSAVKEENGKLTFESDVYLDLRNFDFYDEIAGKNKGILYSMRVGKDNNIIISMKFEKYQPEGVGKNGWKQYNISFDEIVKNLGKARNEQTYFNIGWDILRDYDYDAESFKVNKLNKIISDKSYFSHIIDLSVEVETEDYEKCYVPTFEEVVDNSVLTKLEIVKIAANCIHDDQWKEEFKNCLIEANEEKALNNTKNQVKKSTKKETR